MALLLGYGAGAINPYLAFETLDDMIRQGLLPGLDHKAAVKNYIKALNKGVLKVISKMGISTIQSYRGAQIFEAIGLDKEFVDRYFTWTASRIGGVGIDVVARGRRSRGTSAPSPSGRSAAAELDWGGEYQWRRDGEYHLFNPETVFKLQHATRSGQYGIFKEYTALVDAQSTQPRDPARALRASSGAPEPVPLEEVEPVEAILRRFATGRHVLRLHQPRGARDARHRHEPHGRQVEHRRGRRGSRRATSAMPTATSGAARSSRSPPAASASPASTWSTRTTSRSRWPRAPSPARAASSPGTRSTRGSPRCATPRPGVGLISPPPHHDIYSIEDLAQLIHDLKNANPRARISVKLVSEVGVGTVAAGVAKAHSDVVLISGHDGGTGAAPAHVASSTAGTPWELGLAETQQVLVMNKLRDRIIVQTDGQMKTGRDVVIARPPGGRGVRLLHRPPRGHGLHHDAGLPPQHLPGGHRHPGSAAPREVHGQARVRRELLPLHRRGGARAHGAARLPDHGRDDRPRGPPRRQAPRWTTGRRGASTSRASSTGRRWAPRSRCARWSSRTTASTSRST